jgi:hypothetical protein
VKAPRDPRARRRRAPIKLTPQELAWAREDAIRWRVALRAERNGGVAAQPAEPAKGMAEPRDAAERARFAAAIARAEFGRFYLKEAGKAPRRKPAPNGKG